MSKRVTLLALVSFLILSVAGCGSEPAPQTTTPAPAPAAAKKEEPVGPIYDLTKESLTDHPDWTSRNVGILGAKIGDKTNTVQENFGKLDNARTLADEYLTVYQGNGVFVYTQKLTGKIRKFEVYDTFSKEIKDEKLKKLLSTGDLKYMREIFGNEEKTEENTDDQATEYVYDARGFRFVKYKVGARTVNALRFVELKKATT